MARWALVQMFLSSGRKPEIYEVEMDLDYPPADSPARCSCPAFARATKQRRCKHTDVVVARAIWLDEYPVMIERTAHGTPHEQIFKDDQSYRLFVAEHSKVEVI